MAWTDHTLAAAADVRARYARAGDLTEKTIVAEQDTEIEAYIARTKEFFGRMLDRHLLTYRQRLSLSDYPNLKDYITNADTVFKHAAVAWALKLLFEDNSVREDDYNAVKMREFEAEFKREWDLSVGLMEFDADASGALDDDEAGQGARSYRFDRV